MRTNLILAFSLFSCMMYAQNTSCDLEKNKIADPKNLILSIERNTPYSHLIDSIDNGIYFTFGVNNYNHHQLSLILDYNYAVVKDVKGSDSSVYKLELTDLIVDSIGSNVDSLLQKQEGFNYYHTCRDDTLNYRTCIRVNSPLYIAIFKDEKIVFAYLSVAGSLPNISSADLDEKFPGFEELIEHLIYFLRTNAVLPE